MSAQIVKEKRRKLPELYPLFPLTSRSPALHCHIRRAKEILQQLLHKEFLSLSRQDAARWLSQNLPILSHRFPEKTPGVLTFQILCSPTQEVKAEKVLLEVLRKWLIPEKEIHILGYFNFYFTMRGISSKLLFLSEIEIFLEDNLELNTVQQNLPLLANELSLSLSSSRYLESILDTKALTLDQKSSQVQFYLRKLLKRSPNHIDIEIFKEMSTFYALSLPEFQKFRMPKHITRIIVSHFIMRKKILHGLSVSPKRRQLEFRFIRSKLYFPFGAKQVLGLSIAVAFSDRYETFEDIHALEAVQKFVPNLQIVKGSYYFYRPNHDSIKYLYLELEKKDGSPFQQKEIRLLNRELKEQLKKRIERLIPSVFMIRNEEEVMRNVLLLSQELKYLSDIPQVMVNFEKQEGEEIFFTVLVVRILRKHDLPLERLFTTQKYPFRFLQDRVQNVGYIRKRNPKEANVFHLCIPKERSILRVNSSVNFYLARQRVIAILTEALGEIRDYNGGMILKQGELFSQFKEAFTGIATKDQELIENFFFALSPIESQATTSLHSLKTLFQLCLEATGQELPKRESSFHKIIKKRNKCFAVLRTKDKGLETILNEEINHLVNFSKSLVKTQFHYQGTWIQGIIYEITNSPQYKQFQKAIESSLKKWVSKVMGQQQLRLSFIHLPLSLDPRLGGDEYSSNVIKMLYEGLTRVSRDSKPSLALARSIEISGDQKKYIFKLRHSQWSDGSPLIAYNFEYAWKKILSPLFYTPFAYFFYPIKNAKAVKEGRLGLEKVGIKALDDQTLVVDLEHPTPEFLEMISHPLYSPINHKLERLHPNWAQGGPETYICNGPMQLKEVQPSGGYIFQKNPYYWDQENVKLHTIVISKTSPETAIEMYKNDEIDWIGHPMGPWESYFSTGDREYYTKFLGSHWCVFNTQRYPFNHLKMRKAFALAVNRHEISKLFPQTTMPASTPLPHIHTSIFDKDLSYGDKKMALQLFEEALRELGMTRKNFPIISLCFGGGKAREMIAKALVKTWEKVFGISCRLEDYPFDIFFPKLIKGDFHLGMMNWKAWINDPFYTLGAFQYRTNKINFSKWEHPKYQKYLDCAKRELIAENRIEYFKKAEEILIQEYPVIPIIYEAYRYTHKAQLRGAFCSDTGNIDFRWASISPH